MKYVKEFLVATALTALAASTAVAQGNATTPSSEPRDIADTIVPTQMVESNRTMLLPPMMTYIGYSTVMIGEIPTDALKSAEVYGSDDKNIGDVEILLLGTDGMTVEHIVFDIGGFLGMGVHKVALTPDEVQIMRNDNGDELRVYINATKSELEEQPEYEG